MGSLPCVVHPILQPALHMCALHLHTTAVALPVYSTPGDLAGAEHFQQCWRIIPVAHWAEALEALGAQVGQLASEALEAQVGLLAAAGLHQNRSLCTSHLI